MSITREDAQRKLAELQLAKLERMQAEQDRPVRDAIVNATSGLNRGVLQAVGLPVDLMNTAAGLIGLDVEEPVGGYKWLSRMASNLDIGQRGRGTFAGRAAESVGAGAAGLGVVGGVSRVARAGAPFLQAFRQAPGTTTALELSAATGGGLGAATAQELFPESRTAELVGEVGGAVLNPVGLTAAATRGATRRLRNTTDLFTRTGQERRAGADLLMNAENPEAVRRVIGNREFQESVLTPAQATGDRGLMTLERSAARFSAEAERRYADTVDEINAAIRAQLDEAADVGQPLAPRQQLEAEMLRMNELLDANVEAAFQRARQRIDDLGGRDVVVRTRANTIARQQLEEAKAAARVQEAELWNAVPGEAVTLTSTVEDGYRTLIAARARTADPADVPDFIHEFLRPGKAGTKLGGRRQQATVDELQTLRSRILAEVRKEEALRKGANRNKIRILDGLQEDILEDLGLLGHGPVEIAEPLNRAREFSRLLNEKFTQGSIGRVFGHERGGGLAIDPELTLETLIGQAGPRAAVDFDALMRATDNNPEVLTAVRDHVTQRFFAGATDATGAVVPARAEAFLRNNANLLERMPSVRRQLEDAAFEQRAAIGVERAARLERAVLHDKNRNVAALYLNAPPSKEINKILEASPEPVNALRELKARMAGDAAGEAGLKAAYIREMIGRAELAKFDATGRPGFDANRFVREVTQQGKIGREAGIFTADDVARMERIADIAQKAQAPSRVQARNLSELIGTDIGTGLFDLITRITAANVGSQSVIGRSSGAELVTAGFTVRWVRRLLAQTPSVKIRNILAEAMFDKDLFELLLKRAETPEQAVEFSQRLNTWLVNLGIDRTEEGEQ